MSKRCEECHDESHTFYRDKREFPLAGGECLCAACAIAAIDERIDELRYEIGFLVESQEKIKGASPP